MTDSSLHTHSLWSDGAADLFTMANAAREAGLRTFGFSDHWILQPPPGKLKTDWGIDLTKTAEYFKECQKIKQQLETDDFTIKIGLEVDFFPETWRESLAFIRQFPLDYTIGSIHFLDGFPVDGAAEAWAQLTQEQINDTWQRYWQRLLMLTKTGVFDIIGHLDLPKKFGYRPNVDFSPDIDAVLEAVRDSGAQLELNTSGWSKPCEEQYPSTEILSKALQLKIPILITADAHDPNHINRDFDRAKKLLQSLA